MCCGFLVAEACARRFPLYEITLGGKDPRWHSTTAAQLPRAALDVLLLRELRRQDRPWADSSKAWWCCLLRGGPFAVQLDGGPGEAAPPWFLTLSDCFETCGLAWPATRTDPRLLSANAVLVYCQYALGILYKQTHTIVKQCKGQMWNKK